MEVLTEQSFSSLIWGGGGDYVKEMLLLFKRIL